MVETYSPFPTKDSSGHGSIAMISHHKFLGFIRQRPERCKQCEHLALRLFSRFHRTRLERRLFIGIGARSKERRRSSCTVMAAELAREKQREVAAAVQERPRPGKRRLGEGGGGLKNNIRCATSSTL